MEKDQKMHHERDGFPYVFPLIGSLELQHFFAQLI